MQAKGQILTNKRDAGRLSGERFSDEKQENGDGQEDGDRKRDLLSAFWGQPEDEEGAERNERTGDDEGGDVIKGATLDNDGEVQSWVGIVTAIVGGYL